MIKENLAYFQCMRFIKEFYDFCLFQSAHRQAYRWNYLLNSPLLLNLTTTSSNRKVNYTSVLYSLLELFVFLFHEWNIRWLRPRILVHSRITCPLSSASFPGSQMKVPLCYCPYTASLSPPCAFLWLSLISENGLLIPSLLDTCISDLLKTGQTTLDVPRFLSPVHA